MTTYRTPQSLIAMIRRVQSPRGRRRAGLFAIEGTRLVERALRAGAALEDVLIAGRLVAGEEGRHHELLAALQAAGCRITAAPDNDLINLTEGRDMGLIMGLVRLPPPTSLAALLAGTLAEQGEAGADPRLSPRDDPAPLLLAAVDIVDPGNVGALTRTAHAAGAAALLVSGAGDAYHPRATRISRGSIFKLPVIEYETNDELLRALRQQPVMLVGTAARDATPLPTMEWPHRPIAVLMGNEAEGLSPEVVAALDYTVTIPMPAGVDSFSVNAAAAIVLYMARSRHPGGR